MLGFGKKKKEDETAPETDQVEDGEKAPSKQPSKKRFPIKKIFIILLVLVAVGASGFIVYNMYFSSKGKDGPPIYVQMELPHVQLPEETIKFSFEHFPDLYQHIIAYNQEITLIDQQILKIDTIGKKYPDQAKIADKEKKTWEKAKQTLEKSLQKIEKPVQDIYVQFLVNPEAGKLLIDARKEELTKTAADTLTTIKELTDKLKTEETIPEGLIQGTLYKIKKKLP